MNYWSEIQNNHFVTDADMMPEEGDICASISIDAWKTDQDWEEGKVIAHVLLSHHGDILVSYHDNVARLDEQAQKAISEAKEQLREHFIQLQKEADMANAAPAAHSDPSMGPVETVPVWMRLGVSLDVTWEELAALKAEDLSAQQALVSLLCSGRCRIDGETYFPGGQEHIEKDLDVDLPDMTFSAQAPSKERGNNRKPPLIDRVQNAAKGNPESFVSKSLPEKHPGPQR